MKDVVLVAKEVDGLEMGVLSDGKSFLTSGGSPSMRGDACRDHPAG